MANPTVKYKPRILNYSDNPMYVVLESDKFTGASAPYDPTHPNLSCYIEVYEYDQDLDEDTFLAKFHVPYSPYTKEATLNLSGVLQLKDELPDLTETEGQLTDPITRLWFQYADQWGTPVTPDTVDEFKNNDKYFTVIKGSARKTIGDMDLIGGIPLHSYKNDDGNFFAKLITNKQPDWLFFYLSNAGSQDVKIDITLYFDDGTNEAQTQTTRSLEGKNINWISVSYTDLIAPLSPAKTVIAYDVLITTPVLLGNTVIVKQKYILDDCSDRDIYLAVPNGLGGIESVRLRGRTTEDFQVSRQLFEKSQWGEIDEQDGNMDSYNHQGQKYFNTNTGYYSEDYINHIRNIILTPSWIIDTVNDTYKKVIPVSNSLKAVKDNMSNLFSLPLKFAEPRKDSFVNSFHINEPA